ncbi:hypothetical protein [Dactylosporangium sp. NPDC048998]|uniref:hypothetical protein n=1 Tax=Dactylosporangium sp. NPDC048998 TaxID=3363976 RepID=UPI003715C414
MNDRRLRFDMADLADQVTPVDLRDRALRTSRRLGFQRALATSAAVLVVLGSAAGIAFAVRPSGDGLAPTPASSSDLASAPPTGTTAEPQSSAGASSAPANPQVLAGTRYYLGSKGGELQIHAVRGDTDQVTARIPDDSARCVSNSITVSPDGRRLAWVQGPETDGTLMTASVDGSSRQTVAKGVVCLGTTALVWRGGDRLMVQKNDGTHPILDLPTGGSSTGSDSSETFEAWSADGRWSAGRITDKRTVTNGQDRHYYTYTPPKAEADHWDGWAARSVSMDGRYVSIGWIGTDAARRDDSFTVVDTTSSKVVALPVSGEVRSITFTSDNKVLVRQRNRIVVLDSQFHNLGELTETQEQQAMTLLAYAP